MVEQCCAKWSFLTRPSDRWRMWRRVITRPPPVSLLGKKCPIPGAIPACSAHSWQFWSTLRRLLPSCFPCTTWDENNGGISSQNRHRRRAMGLISYRIIVGFWTFLGGFIPAFLPVLHRFAPLFLLPSLPFTPCFTVGLGYSCSRMDIPENVDKVEVSARFCPFRPVLP